MNAEHEVRQAIASALGVDADEIGEDADLIELGLDSIRMMKIAGGWRKRGHRLNFAQLAASPTVDAWATMLAATAPAVASPSDPRESDAGESATPESATPESAAPESAAPEHDTPAPVDASTHTTPAADDPFPLAPMQHAYWIGRTDAADLGNVAAHLYVEFDGAGLEPDRLHAAVTALVARHPMLRARFLPDGTQQILARPARDPFSVQDLRDRTADDADRALDATRDRTSHQKMDVASGQVIDITLSLLPAGRHRLHVDVDMLVADAMSYRMLLADLVALYDGDELDRLDVTYRDYLQRRAEDPDPAHDRDRDWWAGRLDDLPAGPALPTRPDLRADDANRVVRHHYWLDADAKEELLAAAHERGVTPAIALAAVFASTLGAWSADDRFLLNVPLFHREPVHPDIDRVSGDFSSSILIDVDTRHADSVLGLTRSMQKTMHENGSHSAYGALEVLRDLGRARGEQVLAPVVYTSALGLGELFSENVLERLGDPSWIVSQGPQVMLDAQVTEVRGGLLLNWDVREAVFPDGVVDAMFAHYVAAIERLRTGDAGWMATSAPSLPADQHAVRQRVNDTAGPTSERVLHQEFFSRAISEPERTALIWRDGELTYGELARRALTVAGALRSAGVLPGDAVAVSLPKGPDQVVATLGVVATGAIWVPIAHDHPPRRRAMILDTGDIRVVLGEGRALDELPDGVAGLDLASALDHRTSFTEAVLPPRESIAYILFTSGSTGTPKGVEVSHRAAMNTIDDINDRFGVGPADRTLTVAALEFDISVYDIFGIFSAGGAVIAVAADDARDPSAWLDLLARHGASVLTCVPSALDMLLTVAESAHATGDGARLDSLRAVLLGGDWVGVDLPRRLHALAPAARFAGLGGATEFAIHGTVCEVVDPPAHWTSVPFGTPLRNVECRVVDSSDRDRPDWVTGELWVGGAGVAHGYRNDPDRTAERFVEREGRRWYRTGDLARYWPDGTIEFLGRADHQVKVRGFRVELGEVEGALRAVGGVRHAVATLTGTPGGPRALAAVVATGESATGRQAAPTADRLLDDLRDLLPGYMIPSRLEVVDHLPLTSNGKLDRTEIARMVAASGSDDHPGSRRVEPDGDLERALLSIVADVLRADERHLGVTDDFFAVGGDSVLATTVVARVREWLDAPQVGVVDIFAARTVRDLARRIDAADERPGRLDQVAALYLEVAAMDDEQLSESLG
ncbi:amino acid adenylation domain-containing protein [Gordonia sp. ABSL11-1]|uniref:non-ribosomal peptide synthetase n=1 Tax=Gordonia sp. ABSL11-1 TaxID=3053924 RepID=UPI0025722BCD|nr:amino acid adenylation domain-containing protein [Gordonia sp. ABSL11-1]MDL9946663.1 amino acid adenylation domain-containing protein [Gordonia sp. ABSL11-1]